MYHDDPILKKTSIYRGCSIAIFDYRTAIMFLIFTCTAHILECLKPKLIHLHVMLTLPILLGNNPFLSCGEHSWKLSFSWRKRLTAQKVKNCAACSAITCNHSLFGKYHFGMSKRERALVIFNGHDSGTDKRPIMAYLIFRPKCQAISPEKKTIHMAKHMVRS